MGKHRIVRIAGICAISGALAGCSTLSATKEGAYLAAERLQARICALKADPTAAAALAEVKRELEARGWKIEVPCSGDS